MVRCFSQNRFCRDLVLWLIVLAACYTILPIPEASAHQPVVEERRGGADTSSPDSLSSSAISVKDPSVVSIAIYDESLLQVRCYLLFHCTKVW